MSAPGQPGNGGLDSVLQRLPELARVTEDLRDVLIANLVMMAEIPAPTFGEAPRVETLLTRFNENGLLNCSMDQLGNGMGLLPGTDGQRSILLVAQADSVFDDTVDHTVSVQPDRIHGCDVCETSLGLAALATLPTLLEKLGLRLRSNLVLLAASRCTGRGNLEGLRQFLAHHTMSLQHGICLNGAPLGRLSYQAVGMRRGEIRCKVPAEYDWTRFGAASAVLTINQVVSRIAAIPVTQQPVSSIVLGSIEAGHAYDHAASQAVLRFELLSESPDVVQQLGAKLGDIVAEVAAQSGAEVVLDIFAQREPGGIPIGHAFVRTSRQIIEKLGVPLRLLPDAAELSALIDAKVPAVAIGLSLLESTDDEHEVLQIRPLYQGMAQLLALLLAID